MFPIFILNNGNNLPDKGTYYVVAKDGLFLVKDTGIIQATVRVDKISFLKELKPSARIMLPKLPSWVMTKALLFFRRVYEKHHSEAAVLLCYSRERSSYMLDAPKQQVSSASVDYKPLGRYADGYQLVGTIHSHCDFGAFHSGVDKNDERYFDGIHITIGNVQRPYFTTVCSLVVNNNRFPSKPEEMIVGITKVDYQPPTLFGGYKRVVPRDKADQFDFQAPNYLKYGLAFGSYGYSWQREPDQYYDLVLPDGQDYRNYPPPQSWLDRVEKKSYLGIFTLKPKTAESQPVLKMEGVPELTEEEITGL